jgi:hypothetical protein
LLHSRPGKLTRRARRKSRMARSYLCRPHRAIYAATESPAVRSAHPDEPYRPLVDPDLPVPVWRGPPAA